MATWRKKRLRDRRNVEMRATLLQPQNHVFNKRPNPRVFENPIERAKYIVAELSTGHELSVRMGFQISLGDGDYGSGISRYWDRHWSFHAGGRGAWAAAGL